jgi:hypothetical protein
MTENGTKSATNGMGRRQRKLLVSILLAEGPVKISSLYADDRHVLQSLRERGYISKTEQAATLTRAGREVAALLAGGGLLHRVNGAVAQAAPLVLGTGEVVLPAGLHGPNQTAADTDHQNAANRRQDGHQDRERDCQRDTDLT